MHKGPKQKGSGLAIIGADVFSLLPSMSNIDTARIAKKVVLQSKVDFEDIDYQKALRYMLSLVMFPLINLLVPENAV